MRHLRINLEKYTHYLSDQKQKALLREDEIQINGEIFRIHCLKDLLLVNVSFVQINL
jgi:hypothetical protein